MKKLMVLVMVMILLLTACNAVKVQEPVVEPTAQTEAHDPVIESLATQQAELAQLISKLATQVANLTQSNKKAKAQPVSGNKSVCILFILPQRL